MTRVIVVLIVVALLTLPVFDAPVLLAEQADVYIQIGEIVGMLEELYRKGVDVAGIVKDLNTIIQLASSGNKGEALARLEQVKNKLREVEYVAESIYITKTVSKYVLVGFIASIPIVVYLVLPRVYLYLWYSVRKRWIVRW